MAESLDALSWYSGKIEVVNYLEDVNAKEKVAIHRDLLSVSLKLIII